MPTQNDLKNVAEMLGRLRQVRYIMTFAVVPERPSGKEVISGFGLMNAGIQEIGGNTHVYQGKDGYWYRETSDQSGAVITKEQFSDKECTQSTGYSAICDAPTTDPN